ncbi:MAG: hypothetical protein JOZ17_06835 [Acetobacteraceae bacterium]|nr:hypothetical protein [Acetobacteraceae bacterium]
MDADELAVTLGKQPTGGYWNSGISVLRSNGPIQADGRLTERRRYFANNLVSSLIQARASTFAALMTALMTNSSTPQAPTILVHQ